MAESAVGQKDRCVICDNEYNPFNPLAYPPTCSSACWWLWTNVINHRDGICWITGCLEVYCGLKNPGYCNECNVFKVDREIKGRN